MTAPDEALRRELADHRWSPNCEFRDPYSGCRNPDGCHCREIAALIHTRAALTAKVEALTNSLASAIAYIEVDLGLDDPDTVAGQIAAMDLRTGETRTFDCMAARAILKETSDAADR